MSTDCAGISGIAHGSYVDRPEGEQEESVLYSTSLFFHEAHMLLHIFCCVTIIFRASRILYLKMASILFFCREVT